MPPDPLPNPPRDLAGQQVEQPRGELAVRTLAMPADTNPSGDIFGGWLMSMMDTAGGITARQHAEGRVVTAAVTQMSFLGPVKVGDVVCCYTDLVSIGRSSLKMHVEAWVLRLGRASRLKVTEAEFTFVAIDENGRPRMVSGEAAASGSERPQSA